MLQGGEGCQEFSRVVGDRPVHTLDLLHPESVEGVGLLPQCHTPPSYLITTTRRATHLPPSRNTFEQIRETFLLPTIKAGFKRYNFDSIVGLINYAFMSFFLYLWEKTRLHISLPCH